MTANIPEIERIYNLIYLFRMSKMDVGEYIKITPKFIEDFRSAVKAVTQANKEIIDPNLQCFISAANTGYDIPYSVGYSHALLGIGLGAITGGLFGAVFGKVVASTESLAAHPIHRGSVIAFTLLGAAALGQNFFEEKLNQIKMDIFEHAALSCYSPEENIELSGVLSEGDIT